MLLIKWIQILHKTDCLDYGNVSFSFDLPSSPFPFLIERLCLDDHYPCPWRAWGRKQICVIFFPLLSCYGCTHIVMGLEHGKECLEAYGTRTMCPGFFSLCISIWPSCQFLNIFGQLGTPRIKKTLSNWLRYSKSLRVKHFPLW